MVRIAMAAFSASLATAFLAPAADIAPRFTNVEPPKAEYLVHVLAPQARCLAVSDTLGWIAAGHKAAHPAQITLYKLDPQGKPTGAPIAIKTPVPAYLTPRNHYVLGLLFHPRLPLLYVWQDVEASKADPPPPEDPAWKEFDHLLIYNLAATVPELVFATARGKGFCIGVGAGGPAFDADASRLYVPNLRFGDKVLDGSGIGIYHLEPDGLPMLGEAPAADKPPASPVDAQKAAADRPARVAALRAALAANKPIGAFWYTPINYGFYAIPSGAGIHPLGPKLFIAQGTIGIVTWDEGSRRVRTHVLLMPTNMQAYYVTRLVGHPVLPVIFSTAAGYEFLYRVEHIDGQPTLAPQVARLPKYTVNAPPIVLTRRKLVGVGGPGVFMLVAFDANGKLKEEGALTLDVPGQEVDGYAYSEKLDRLYLAVEKLPK